MSTKTIIIGIITAICLVALVSCDLGGSGGTSPGFYSDAKLVLPTFTENQAAGISRAVWSSDTGTAMYALWNKLRDFDPAIHEGVIDRSNIYKMLYDAEGMASGAADTLPAAKVIHPPYSFGNNLTYDSAKNKTGSGSYDNNCIARSTNGNVIATWIWGAETDEHREYGVLESNPTGDGTSDIAMDFVFSVDYASEGSGGDATTDYNLRAWYSGNPATHEFRYKSFSGSGTDSSGGLAMIGAGFSSGLDNYFLFRINGTSDVTTDKYFIISIDDGADELYAMEQDLANNSYNAIGEIPSVKLDTVPQAIQDWIVAESHFTWNDMMNSTKEMAEGKPTGTIALDF